MWKGTGIFVTGTSHISNETPCQDRAYWRDAGGCSLITLADGAGSARLSHYGAEQAAVQTSGYLSDHFDAMFDCADGALVKQRFMAFLQAELSQLAEKLSCEKEAVASTLLAVAVRDNRFILVHIGDGVIGCLKAGELIVATHPENGEFCNQTIFTTSPDAISAMRLIKGTTEDIAGFILMSDGTEASLYSKKEKTLAPAAMKLMLMRGVMDDEAFGEKLSALMTGFFTRKTNDDCSLALLVDEEKIRSLIALLDASGTGRPAAAVRYEAEILAALERSCSVKQLTRQLHISSKAVYRKINNLQRRGCVSVKDGKYIVRRKADV